MVSADTDFGTLLSRSRAARPSIVLFRVRRRRRAHELAPILLDNLDVVAEDLDLGAVVVIEDERIRIRRLPLFPPVDNG